MDADSSITFWLRRWMVQSRTPAAHTAPWWSAMTCTSMCREAGNRRSRKRVASPKLFSASAPQASNASASSLARCTRRMPLPPPPAVALTIRG